MSVKIKHKNPDALKKVYERMGQVGKKEVAVGFPAGKAQAYPDGTAVAFVAACHVYGMHVPKRDFMALAKGDIIRDTKEIMKAVKKTNDPKVQKALMNAAGQAAVKDIKKAIVDLDQPPNAPATIARKGDNNPLIDTGHMLQSVTYIVRDKT